MKQAYSIVLSALMGMGLVLFNTGCSSSQVDKTIAVVMAEAQVAQNALGTIGALKGDPKFGQFFTVIYTAAVADLPVIEAAVAAWKADKSAGKLAAISGAVNAAASLINEELLAANKISNGGSEQKAMEALLAFSAIFNGMAAALGTVNAQLVLPSGFHAVVAMTPKVELDRMAQAYGVSRDQIGGM